MNSGIITNNESSSRGGGVFIGMGTFIKTGNSIITGYASNTENGNRVASNPLSISNGGHAAYASSSNGTKRMEYTVGEGVDISYYYNSGSPIWWGDWE
jgi:hypothetical protein